MAEKSYFYTDPLAAAWMAKHFGMQFDSCPSNSHFTPEGAPLSFYPSQYIVHPDSLHLLEPQPDDIVLVNDGEGANHLTWWRDGMDAKAVVAILQRDGVPFIRSERGEGATRGERIG